MQLLNEHVALSGQFYVMMSPQDMLQSGTSQSGRTIINRSQFSQWDHFLKFFHNYSFYFCTQQYLTCFRRDDGTKTSRDDTRRVQHNEGIMQHHILESYYPHIFYYRTKSWLHIYAAECIILLYSTYVFWEIMQSKSTLCYQSPTLLTFQQTLHAWE